MSENPFAAPLATAQAVGATGQSDFLVDGKRLIVNPTVVLPHRCIRCNAEQGEDGKRLHKKIYYAPPLLFLLILLNFLILLIVYLIVRKSVVLDVSLCGVHRRQKQRRLLGTLISFLVTVGCLVGAGLGVPMLGVVSIPAAITFLVFAVLAARGLSVPKRDGHRYWIAGFGKDFLDSLSAESAR